MRTFHYASFYHVHFSLHVLFPMRAFHYIRFPPRVFVHVHFCLSAHFSTRIVRTRFLPATSPYLQKIFVRGQEEVCKR